MTGEVFILALVLICIAVGVAARLIVRPKTIRVQGYVPPTVEWFENVLTAANRMSLTRWTVTAFEKLDDDGKVIGYLGEIATASELIEVRAPLLNDGREFGDDDYFPVTIALQRYAYRRSPLWLLLAGKYPENHVMRARARLLKAIRREIRRAARRETEGRLSREA